MKIGKANIVFGSTGTGQEHWGDLKIGGDHKSSNYVFLAIDTDAEGPFGTVRIQMTTLVAARLATKLVSFPSVATITESQLAKSIE